MLCVFIDGATRRPVSLPRTIREALPDDADMLAEAS
jgi:acyl-CoA thioesterase FadM